MYDLVWKLTSRLGSRQHVGFADGAAVVVGGVLLLLEAVLVRLGLRVAQAVHVAAAGRAADHVAVGGGAVGAAAQRAARALVALLVARVAHRVVRVPARRRAGAGRARAAVRAHAAALALPAVLGHGGHDGPQARGVVQLVAVLARHGARLAPSLAAHLAHAARAARPARADACPRIIL